MSDRRNTKSQEITAMKEIPGNYLISCINEAERNIKDRNYYFFKDNQEAIDFLDKSEKKETS